MATIQLPPDFKEFLRLLNSNEVEYLVIGGYAVNYYGYARATADLDIWIGITPGNAETAARVVREFGFAQADGATFLEPGKVIRMGVPPGCFIDKRLDQIQVSSHALEPALVEIWRH